jgi:hypothetical protein
MFDISSKNCRNGLSFEPGSYIEVVVRKIKPKPSISTLLEEFCDVGMEECACCERVAYTESNRFYVLPR